MRTSFRLFVAALFAATGWAASASKLELRGKVSYSAARFRTLRVAIYRVESPFTASTLTDPGGEFRFHGLLPGSYTVSVLRRGLGEVRRSVVISPALADKKGIVRMEITFSPAEAALNSNGGTVSKTRLKVPLKAARKYIDAEQRLSKSDVKGALKSLEEAVKIAPLYTAAWNFQGVLAYQGGDLLKAESLFRKALEIEPESFEPTVNLGGILLARGRPREALQYNEKAVQLRPKDALGQGQLGMNYFSLGRLEEAQQHLEQVKEADPAHFTRPQLYLSRIYERRGDAPAAARELEDLLARHPDSPEHDLLQRRLERLQESH
jgi:Tfp pilus assembly protein PilF